MDALYALGIGINNGAKAYALANGDEFPVVQQEMMIIMISLFSRSSVCFSVCLRMHLRTPQFGILHHRSPYKLFLQYKFSFVYKIFLVPPDSEGLQGSHVLYFS